MKQKNNQISLRKNLFQTGWILIFLYMHLLASSQITIVSSDMPSPGDTVRMSTGLNTDVAYEETGEDYFWDFSQLLPLVQDVDTFVPPSATPFFYQLFFAPYSNLAHRSMQDLPIPDFEVSDIYYYYKNGNNEYSQIGYALSINSIPLPIRFGNPDVLYRFPLNYADRDSSSSIVEYDLPGTGYMLIDRFRRNTVDGWGVLATPFGTFDVLRVKSEVHEFDSIYIDSLQMGIPINRDYTEYKWLAQGQKEPVLQITSDVAAGLLVVYRDSARMGLNALSAYVIRTNSMVVYPNPAMDEVMVEFDLLKPSGVVLEIYDLRGSNLYREQLIGLQTGVNRKALNMENIFHESGLYLVKLKAGRQVVTEKLIIRK